MYEEKSKKIIIGCIIASVILMIFLTILLINDGKKENLYKIKFDSDGGTYISDQLVKSGGYVKKPTDPIKEGYQFIDWAYNNVTYDFKNKVTKDITLVARWFKLDESVESFTIKFDSDGGTTIPNQVIKKGEVISKPIDPVKEGYLFKGWMINGVVYDFSKSVESDLELVAIWEKVEHDVTTKKITKTTTTNQDKKPVETTKPATTTKKVETTKPVQTTTKTKQKYIVTFNSNGGSTVSSQTITEGGKVTKPSNPTRSGYNFIAWTLNGSNYNFDSVLTSNITLVAKWNQKSYTIKISAVDDYSPARVLSVYEDGSKITVKEIRYSDGTYLCSGANPNVNKNVIAGETKFIVVLSDGTHVTAIVS